MGIATIINEKIKHAIIFPFWRIVSPDSRYRLFMHLIERINCFYYGSRGKYVPDKYLVGISQTMYRKIEKEKEILIEDLKKDVEEYFIAKQFSNKYVSIDFMPLSYLNDKEIKIFCFFSEESKLTFEESIYYLKLLNDENKQWTIQKPGEYLIGRTTKADFRIDNPYVSLYHAKILYTDFNSMKISDCGSRNGTFINNKKIPKKKIVSIFPGDKILLSKKGKIRLQLFK